MATTIHKTGWKLSPWSSPWIFSLVYQLTILGLIFIFIAARDGEISSEMLRALFANWDSKHYLFIAENGYVADGPGVHATIFYPVYPLLIWLVKTITFLPATVAAVLISSVASIAGHALFIRYLQESSLSGAAKRYALLLLLFSPASVYFSIIYNEGLYLLYSVLLISLLDRQSYSRAAAVGFLASATRLVGILAAVPIFLSTIDIKNKRIDIKSAGFAFLVPAGFGIYLLLNYLTFGNPFNYMDFQASNWFKKPINPVAKYLEIFFAVFRDKVFTFTWASFTRDLDNLLMLVAPWILIYYSAIKYFKKKGIISWPIIIWCYAHFWIFSSQSFWLSSSRYVLLILPLYVMLAEILEDRPLIVGAILGLFSVTLIIAFRLFSIGAWLM